MKKIFKIIEQKTYLIIISIVLALLSSFIALEGPYVLGKMTNVLVEGISFAGGKLTFNIDYDKIKYYLVFILVLYLIVMILANAQALIMSHINVFLSYDIRKRVNDKINRLPISYLDSALDGDIISIIVNDVSTLSMAFNNILSNVIPAIVTILGTIILMLTISIKLTLIVLVFVPLTTIVMIITVKASQKYFKELQEKLAKLNGHIEEMYANHDVILSFNGQSGAIEKFEEINDDLFKASFLSQFLSGLPIPIVTVLNNINYALVSLLGSILLFNSQITIGLFQTFIQYLNGFHRPLSMLSQMSTYIQQVKATSDRIFSFLELEEMSDESMIAHSDIDNIKGNISFEDVDFSYDGKKNVLENLTFNVKAGEKIAIVGHTGSGKTTIINLLMKFYEISKGDIKIDGKSIKNITRENIAEMFTMVLQDTWLFEGSILDNIKFGSSDSNVSFEDVKIASKNANSHHFIKTLPGGYNMILNEQVSNISVGQKQQITIARAFLKNSKMLILDEATSSIDSRTEKLIQESMKELMRDKTTIIIAHRLSTIKDCDKIILLDQGKIVEMGSHTELLQRNGAYARLYNA